MERKSPYFLAALLTLASPCVQADQLESSLLGLSKDAFHSTYSDYQPIECHRLLGWTFVGWMESLYAGRLVRSDSCPFPATVGKAIDQTFPTQQTLYKKNTDLTLGGISFKEIVSFHSLKGLSTIAFLTFPAKKELPQTCEKVKQIITSLHGEKRHERTDPLLTQIIWHTDNGNTIEETCNGINDPSQVVITVQPKWKVLDCSVFWTNTDIGKASFYYDTWNDQLRYFYVNMIGNKPKEITLNDDILRFDYEGEKYVVNTKTGELELTVKDRQTNKISEVKGHCEIK